MKYIRAINHYITAIFFITIITIVVTSYYTFQDVATMHHKRQQEAVVPLFSLVTSEIIKPLTVSHFMANDQFLIDYIEQDKVEIQKLLSYLKRFSEQYNMLTFMALEKHQLMLDSAGKKVPLNEEYAEWFFRLKNKSEHHFADIGNSEDPHLYFDIKVFNEQQEFLGFIGAAIDLNHFSKTFVEFNQRFGFELFFADEHNVITLASSDIMKTESHHRRDAMVKIDTLPWYKNLVPEKKNGGFASENESRLLVSRMPIKELNWTLYIVSPQGTKQSEYWQLFLGKFALFLIVSLLFYFVLIIVVNYFKQALLRDARTDFLTKLPNRSFIHWKFKSLTKRYQDASIVMIDIDHFKKVNDDFGHLKGDEVIKAVAEKMAGNLRKLDLIARWGGEEFLLVLPEIGTEEAWEMTERIRKEVELIPFTTEGEKEDFNVSISCGISYHSLRTHSLKDFLIESDKALYAAKKGGRNKVVIYSE
jgi:diguanylate cyclase (GGDEF)-like protein